MAGVARDRGVGVARDRVGVARDRGVGVYGERPIKWCTYSNAIYSKGVLVLRIADDMILAHNGKKLGCSIGNVLERCLLVEHEVENATEGPHVSIPTNLNGSSEEELY